MTDLDMSVGFRPMEVPAGVATCPICGAAIYIEHVSEWECDGGKPVSIEVECVTEPDMEDDSWNEWHRGHWSMPYVDWLPVTEKILAWLQRNYRCV